MSVPHEICTPKSLTACDRIASDRTYKHIYKKIKRKPSNLTFRS